jgi:uncharacterized protein DUF6894
MSQYFFRISHGPYAGVSLQGMEFDDHDAAWSEMRRVCADLLGGVARSLKQDGEWRMELLDAASKPVFRVRLTAEAVDSTEP